jgi:oligopeptide/dipeptide ABC transporter ATP-binding protein
MSAPHLSVRGVVKTYALGRARFGGPERFVHAVDGVTFDVQRGETLGLVGESGCGKSTLARLIMQLETPTAGSIAIEGTDYARASTSSIKAARRRFQMIFQDPYSSLNPRMTTRAIIGEALSNYRLGNRAWIAARVRDLASLCGLSDYHLERYPHQLSGGQCQRVGIARAIALEPGLIVADEPVSALDVSIQAQVLNLIVRLQREMGLTLIFVSHDLSIVAHVADRVAVMYLGRIVEIGPSRTVFGSPVHPYARTLLEALPRPAPSARIRRSVVVGELPSPLKPPSGCHFRTRCPHADARCAAEAPALRTVAGREIACHHAERILDASNNSDASPSHA